MIVDSSAIVSVLTDEEDAGEFLFIIQTSAINRLSAANYLEAAIVIDSYHRRYLTAVLDDFITTHAIQVEPVTGNQARFARNAYLEYGKGSGHPARLNFGDCFAYALAIETGEPLLFKGNDFNHTDVMVALLTDR